MNNGNNQFYKDPRKFATSLLIFIALIMFCLLIINIVQNDDSRNADNPYLKFLVSGNLEEDHSLNDLKENIETHKIEFYDPQYQKDKSYEAFALQDVLQFGFGDRWESSAYTDIAFEALDGYTSITTMNKLKEPGGYLVFRDLEYEDWEPVSIKESYPGPYYIVWTGKDQATANGYPWPWQLFSIDLIKFEDQFSAVSPVGVSDNSDVHKGYEIFKGRCIRCHAMNGEGGKIGPDLNSPQSIVTYRNEYMIKEFIRNPSKYRIGQMPDHTDLSEQNLDDLISYFRYMDQIRN